MTQGDRVKIRFKGREVEGVVVLASENGKSLALEFDAMLGGYVSMMPVLDAGDGYRDLVTNSPVEITKL
jgi:hypothetical protein